MPTRRPGPALRYSANLEGCIVVPGVVMIGGQKSGHFTFVATTGRNRRSPQSLTTTDYNNLSCHDSANPPPPGLRGTGGEEPG